MDELKNQRDLAVDKINSACARVVRAISTQSSRPVRKFKDDIQGLFDRFEHLHIQYVTKSRTEILDEENKKYYDDVQNTVLDSVDKADAYLEVEKIAVDNQALQSKFATVNSNGDSILATLEELQKQLYNEDDDQWKPDILTVSAEIVESERQLQECKGMVDELLKEEPREENRDRYLKAIRELERKHKNYIIKIKSYVNRNTPVQGGSSESVSRSESRSRNSSVERVFKNKKMEYPKFGGSIRQYLTFKRDFQEIVETGRGYSEKELSHILRNESLSGEPKSVVGNIYDYKDIWRKLDDRYSDETQVVEIVTKQITGFKDIGDEDYESFIKFTDIIEKAHYDLSALGTTSVLNNPMTVSLILEKCPDWVQKDVTKMMTKDKVSREKEFEYILEFMVDKRKEARKLSRLKEKRKPAKPPPSQPFKTKGNIHAASGQSERNGTATGWKCPVGECSYKQRHMLPECRAFKKLSVDEKGKIVLNKKLCCLCFNSSHITEDCPKKDSWKQCDVQACGGWHSRMLHGAKVQGLVLAIPTVSDETGNVILLVQEVLNPVGDKCIVFWDHGSTTALVTYDYAERNDLSGTNCRFELSGVGDNSKTFQTKLFCVPIIDRFGETHQVCAFGIDKITSRLMVPDIEKAAAVFPEVLVGDLEYPPGEIDLLIGISNISIMPARVRVSGRMGLFSSIFGTGFLLGGAQGVGGGVDQLAHQVAQAGARNVKLDFISAEAYGVDIAKRCGSCRSCKECQFKAVQLSYEEMQELEAIETGLTLNTVEQYWVSEYPFKRDPGILQDNYSQAFACMTSTEKRLKKRNQLEAYNLQFQETVNRGVFEEVSEEEISSYKGPVNYITIVEAYKPGLHSTTPLRLCMNSSLKYNGNSLNDLLMKGPSALNDLFGVTLGFRRHEVAVVKDISKFYQSVRTVEHDQHLRRVLWRDGNTDEKPKIYKTTRVNFGDKPAGCMAQTALRETAKIYQDINKEAASKLIDDTYVDDSKSRAESRDKAEQLSEDMDKIAKMGGFTLKETVMSGDKNILGTPRKVLGLGWDTEKDEIYVETHVNTSSKRKGVRSEPDISLQDLQEKFPEILTKRVIWRIVLGQYDLLGLISVFTIRLKLVMRDLAGGEGEKKTWDEPVSPTIRDNFLEALHDLIRVRDIRFTRCIKPTGAIPESKPQMLIFADGSKSAFCALVYLRYQMQDGTVRCRFISGKTRVAPVKKVSVPRVELLGAVTAVRLAETVQLNLKIEIEARFFFTDSSAVLGMIRGHCASFQEFVGTRVGEIKSKSNPEKEWYWVPTDCNLADMGTRSNVKPEDIVSGSDYQEGMEWMKGEQKSWPVSQTPGRAPEEELLAAARVHLTKIGAPQLIQMEKFSSLNKLINTVGIVFQYLENLKTKKRCSLEPKNIVRAENYLLYSAQDKIRERHKNRELTSLIPMIQEVEGQGGEMLKLVVCSGRLGDQLKVGYDKTALPILDVKTHISKLYMRRAHEEDHSGDDRTLQRSRKNVWIIQGKRLSLNVYRNCFKCKLRNRVLERQIMAPVHESRLPPAPVFNSTAVDLFGPLKIKDSVKKRTSKDCWGVLFCCTVTSAVHLEITEDYSADQFLLCLRRFINLRGTPSRIQSDPGSQLMAAAKEIGKWDFSRLEEWTTRRKIHWHRVPTNSQHFNGVAESMIKVTKAQLYNLIKDKNLTKGELDTLFSEVMQIVNSRPLMTRAGSDPLSGGPITPLHLMGGRATINTPEVSFDEKAGLKKRLAFLEDLKREFWTKWIVQVFPHLVPSYRWRKEFRDVKEGDVVLMKTESELQKKYKLALVKKAFVDKDGHVRRVLLSYKNVDGSSDYKGYINKETERSIHNIIVITPVDWKEEDVEAAITTDLNIRKCSF